MKFCQFNKFILMSIALLALLVPALAAACHVNVVEGNADCNGWNLCARIYFTSDVDTGVLEYTVTVREVTGAPIITLEEAVPVSHEPGAGEYEFCFEGIWEGEYIVDQPVVELTANLAGQPARVFTFPLNCTVDEENISFSAVKAQYR